MNREHFHPNDPETFEPLDSEWSGSPCDVDPDNCWIDDDTGEHVCAATGKRSAHHHAMSDAEREAEAHADMLGCYPEWRP